MSEYSDIGYDTIYFDIIEFLSEYEKLPCLWDKNHYHFKDRQVRSSAEEILGEKMGIMDLKTLRKKIRSVRGTYNTEMRKIKLSIDSGSELYMPKLSWFHLADKFLRVTTDVPNDIYGEYLEDDIFEHEDTFEDKEQLEPSVKELKIVRLESEDDTEDEATKRKPSVKKNSKVISTEPRNHNKHQTSSQFKHSRRRKPLFKQRMNTTREPSLTDVVKSLKDICHASENEFAAFGRSIGVQLQNMPIHLAVQLQTDIQAHITMTRLKYLRKLKHMNEV